MTYGLFSLLLLLALSDTFANRESFQGREEKFRNSGVAFGVISGLESGSVRPELIPTYPNGGMSLELMKNSFVVGFGFIGLTEKLENGLVRGRDTIPSKTEFGILYYPIYLGYIWDLPHRMGVFPHFGIDLNTSYLHDREIKRLGLDPEFGSYPTFKVGVGVYYHLFKWYTSVGYLNGASMLLRPDFGISQSFGRKSKYPNRDSFVFANIHLSIFATNTKDKKRSNLIPENGSKW